jgi:hypothetical protein
MSGKTGSETVDALVYASIPNNLSGNQLNSSGLATKLTISDPQETNKILSEMLDETTIKRACCINKNRAGNTSDKYPVTVRIPTPKDYQYGSNPLSEVWQKFNYIDKTVYIPASMCDELNTSTGKQYDNTTQTCQDFMALYCANVNAFYTDEVNTLGTPYSDDEFANYKPECACFAETPSYIQGAIAPACWAVGCDPNSATAFLDTHSRTPCDVTICNSNFNAAGLSVGGSANINSKVTQQCGNQINAAKKNARVSPVEEAKISTEEAAEVAAEEAKADAAAKGLSAQEEDVAAEEAKKSVLEKSKNTSSSISDWFGKDKNYMGWILIIICVCLIICCICFLMRRGKKNMDDE